MRCVPGFNVRNLPRQDWQTGDNPKYMNRYKCRSPMFMRLKDGEPKPPPPPELHPWVIEAHRASDYYSANPVRPQLFSLDGTSLRQVDKNVNPFSRGDVIAFTFTVSFIVGQDHWAPYLVPLELIRVLAGSPLPSSDFSIPTVGGRPALTEGDIIGGESSTEVYSVFCLTATRSCPSFSYGFGERQNDYPRLALR